MSDLTGIAADPNMPKIGQRVMQRYDVVRLLGQGGFAAVYEAIDTRASGRVAIKILHAEKSFDESFSKRFRQEVMLVRQLQHPNTIKITDAGTTETGCLFMVMEFVDGKELQKVLQETGAMTPDRVIHIGEQVLKALAEAHEKGIVHRDLKPQNIMIGRLAGEDDYVKVLDFGIAKALEPDMQQVHTQAGMVFCTPKYAAPEILMARGVKPAADVYALGLIMSEMLLGHSLIQATSEAETIAAQLGPEPLRLPPEMAQTPLGQVIQRAIAKSLQDRYPGAQEMLADLRAVKASAVTPAGVTPSGFPTNAQAGQGATLHYNAGPAPAGSAVHPAAASGGRTGLIIFLVFLVLAVSGAAAYLVVFSKKGGAPEENGPEQTQQVQQQAAVTDEPDAEQADAAEPEQGPWMGMVAEPYQGEPQTTPSQSAEISKLRLLDESAALNQEAMRMLQQALLAQQIPGSDRDEATTEYLQVVENLMIVMSELDLCDAAARRLDRAFGAGALVAANAAGRIAGMRGQISQCRERLATNRPEWDARDFRRLLGEADETFGTANSLLETAPPQAEVRFFESLGKYQQVLAMLLEAFENERIRTSNRDDASRDLNIIYQKIVHCQLSLQLRISAEATLEAMLNHVELLPADALSQAQELQIMVADENHRAFAERDLAEVLDSDAPWQWGRYQEVVQLAARLHAITRAGAVPAPQAPGGEEPSEGGEEGVGGGGEGEGEAG